MESPIIGNLPGAATDENPIWQRKESKALAVTTTAQLQKDKKSIKQSKVVDIAAAEVNVDQLKAGQKETKSLHNLRANAAGKTENFRRAATRATCTAWDTMIDT